MPTVSIVMPVHNSRPFLSESIGSVIRQTYRDWQLIVVDDGSEDGSSDLASELAEKDSRIRIVCFSSNQGPAVARNTAIRQAEGRYIAFLDSDDVWQPEKLDKQMHAMQEGELDLCYSWYGTIAEDGAPLRQVFRAPKTLTYRKLLSTNYVGNSTAVYDTKRLGKMYMPDIRRRQDYGLWLSILRQPGVRAACVSEVLVWYRIRKSSVSSNKAKSAGYNWKLYRQIEGLGLVRATYYFCRYLLTGILRRITGKL